MPPSEPLGTLERDDIEKQESLIQLIREAWRHGLDEDTTFWFLMNQLKRLLDENVEAGADERHALEEQDTHWQEKSVETLRIQVDSEDIELDDSSTAWSQATEISDASSMPYTARSITSLKDRTNWIF